MGGYSVTVAGDTLPHQLKEPTVDEFDYDYEDTYGYEPYEDDAEAFEQQCLAEDAEGYEPEDDDLGGSDAFEDWRDEA